MRESIETTKKIIAYNGQMIPEREMVSIEPPQSSGLFRL